MENIKVPCFTCRGLRVVYVSTPHPKDPGECTAVHCGTCNGFGVLIATELKRVEKWEPPKWEPPQ